MTDFKDVFLKLNKNLQILREREAKFGGNAPLDLLHQIEDHRQAIDLTEQVIAGELTEADWREALRPLLVNIRDRSEAHPTNCSVSIGDIEGDIIGSIIAGGDVSNAQIAHGSYIAQATLGGYAEVNASTFDQRGQQVSGDQYNPAGDIIIYRAEEEPSFWKRLSRVQLVLAIVLGLIGTTAAVLAVPGVSDVVYGWVTPPPFPSADEDEILIVVATFDRAEEVVDTRPQREVRDAIRAKAAELDFLKLRAEVEETVLSVDDRQAAEALGHQYQASMVIWGDVTGARVIVNFLNLRQPEPQEGQRAINETERVQLKSPDDFASFIVEDLTSRLAFLSLFAVGRSYHIEANYDQALAVMEQAVRSLPADTQSNELTPDLVEGVGQAYLILGWLYQITRSDPQQAITYYDKALTFSQDDAVAYNNRGSAYLELDNLSNAISDFDQAIELAPTQAWGYYNRGNTHSEIGTLTEAIADYTIAITLEPDHAAAYFNRGNAYSDTGKFELAIEDFSQAIKLEPAFLHEAYYNRGDAYYWQGNLEKALADFEQAVDVYPDYYKGLSDFCWTASLLNHAAEALAACDRAVELEPDNGAVRDSRGLALALNGRYAEAKQDFEYYLKWATERSYSSEESINKRKAWIEVLEKGQNPFTEQVLQDLR